MTIRRFLFPLLALLLVGAAALAYASTRSSSSGVKLAANGCPPGYTSKADRNRHERLERLSRGKNRRETEAERAQELKALGCVNRKTPESQAELMTIQKTDAKRSTGGLTDTLKPGAYRSAVRERQAIAADGRTLPGSGGEWKPAGTGPQINDDPRFGEVNGSGLADINGRISDFAAAPDGRVFAAVGEGGVWELPAGATEWRSIGEGLPTQAVGSVGFSTADGGTVIASTGDSVFGGGGTFAGMGVYRTTDNGRTWQKSAGVPDGAISFKVAVDPNNQNVVYVASGAGLFRSSDAGRSFENVALPTGKTDGKQDGEPLTPDCTGAPFGKVGCFQANMVTDVVVQGPANEQTSDAKPGSVVAVVGWRAGQKKSPPSDAFPEGYVESPNNGVYRSDTGEPGSFEKLDADGFTAQPEIGRIELGLAEGAAQDHNILYAIVENAVLFNGGTRGIDIRDEVGPTPNTTVLDGIYVSDDFGASWTKMADAEELKDPTTGSALTGTACAQLYCPGVQAWYNLWIKPDPTAQNAAGVPTRLTFGLEEIWQNRSVNLPQNGKSNFKVVGPYFSGEGCLFLNVPFPVCPTTAGDPVNPNTTTHPDQHAALYVPAANPEDPVRLYVGHDGGVNAQDVDQSADVNPDGWGRGLNLGFNTLLPYDAQIAKDGTIYAGLQDNGELKIEPNGKQYGVYGGDGAFSAVDPDNSDIAYESYTNNDMSKTTDGGKTWTSVAPPTDTYMFINPFTMDPLDAGHILTGGTSVHETTNGAGSWTTVYDLGTRKAPGTDAEAGESDDPDNQTSAVDVRSIPAGTAGGPLKATPDVPEFEAGGDTVPGADAGRTANVPGTFVDQEFTIAPDEANKSATIEAVWADKMDDWDMVVLKDDEEVGESSTVGGESSSEKIVLPNPAPGTYTMRVYNYAVVPTRTFTGKITFQVAEAAAAGQASASYIAFCGHCDALNARPFDNGIATNVSPSGQVGEKGTDKNWHIAKATGLPKRYITSVQIDPADARVIYVTLAGYSRRWLPVGVLGENPDAGRGSVFKSTDAGETFTNVSGNLPDIPANWTLVRNGQLVVATNVGTFISKDTDGGDYEVLGTGLPTAPVFTLEMKPKANPSEPDVMIAATQGRGVYRYEFKDPAPGGGGDNGGGAGPLTPGPNQPGRPSPLPGDPACTSSLGFRSVSAKARGSRLGLGFKRRVNAPVTVDVFRVSQGRRVVRERLIARFRNKRAGFTWNGVSNRAGKRKKVGTGYYFVRYTMARGGRKIDVRRLVLRRANGRFTKRPDYYRRDSCDLLSRYKLERPVFGGPRAVTLKGSYRLSAPARVTVTISKGSKVVKRYKAKSRQGNRTYRFTLPARRRARGDYRVRLRATGASGRIDASLTSRRL